MFGDQVENSDQFIESDSLTALIGGDLNDPRVRKKSRPFFHVPLSWSVSDKKWSGITSNHKDNRESSVVSCLARGVIKEVF